MGGWLGGWVAGWVYVCSNLFVHRIPEAETGLQSTEAPRLPKLRSGRNRPPLSLSKLIKFMGGKDCGFLAAKGGVSAPVVRVVHLVRGLLQMLLLLLFGAGD